LNWRTVKREVESEEARECGLANFPCASFQANRVWLLLV
jgi:hypothetical protein